MRPEAVPRTAFYSPFSFLLDSDRAAEHFASTLSQDLARGVLQRLELAAGVRLYLRPMPWDSEHFGVPTFRLEHTEWTRRPCISHLAGALERLSKHLGSNHPAYYLFAEVPAEDTQTLAALGDARWRLIETRLTCFRDDLGSFEFPSRSATRDATLDDIPDLRRVAAEAINPYDRFHADAFFTDAEAGEFLATFAENSVRGLADVTMVPEKGAADAFLTANYLPDQPLLPGRKIARMVLSAVAPARRGWYVRLVAQMSHRFKELGVDTAFMTTQATNRAVLKVWLRLGYRFGRCTHVFSTSRRDSDQERSR
jgi:dTDP-4-amino-4,6-dideoxy-D-galactose acyltransferase